MLEVYGVDRTVLTVHLINLFAISLLLLIIIQIRFYLQLYNVY